MPRSRYDDDYDDDDDDRPRRRSRRDDDDEYDDDRPRRPSYRYADAPPPKKTNVCGVLSLIGGIASVLANFLQFFTCCCFPSLSAWIPSAAGIVGGVSSLALGITGLVQANKSGGKMGGGMAIAGTILGGVAIIFSVLWLSIFAAFFSARAAIPSGFTVNTTLGTPDGLVTATDKVKATVTAAALAAAYANPDAAADYQDEIIEVTGTLIGGPQYATDGTKVVLAGQTGRMVACQFDPTRRNSVSGLAAGSVVTVRGRCEGLVGKEVKLAGCLLIRGGAKTPDPKPPAGDGLKVTAAELAKAYAADEAAADKKYKGKVLVVTGKIYRNMLYVQPDNPAINLGQKGLPLEIECGVDEQEKKELAFVNLEETITFRGTCTGKEDDVVVLKTCKRVK